VTGEIELISPNSNTIFHNHLLNNAENHAYDEGTNYWDNNGEGNFWSDWQPPEYPDADNNGIVNEPRPIAGGSNVDHYPLVLGYAYPTTTTTTTTTTTALTTTTTLPTTSPTMQPAEAPWAWLGVGIAIVVVIAVVVLVLKRRGK
jgi:hypothetical protein